MIVKKIYFLIKTFISLISINILISSEKEKKKIFFYFPVKIYQEHLIKIVNKIKKESLVILAYNSYSINEIKNYKNSYFIEFNYIKFIPFSNFLLKKVELFISSYLMYSYPPKSKNIYISHDIYDAPMINKQLEKKIFIQINKLDYIFLSSRISIKYFKSKFNFYKIITKPKLVNTGYPKLDYMYKKIKKKSGGEIEKKKTILIAPGYSLNYKKYNMYLSDLKKIIFTLINENKYKVIYRPHPLDLTPKGKKEIVDEIIEQFIMFKNFKEDTSVSYFNSYSQSTILISDISSIAYTYAFATEKPVIFFSKNESLLKKDKFLQNNFIKDRNKIGIICNNSNKIISCTKKIESNYNIYIKKIKSLRKKRIMYFNQSINKIKDEINYIIKKI